MTRTHCFPHHIEVIPYNSVPNNNYIEQRWRISAAKGCQTNSVIRGSASPASSAGSSLVKEFLPCSNKMQNDNIQTDDVFVRRKGGRVPISEILGDKPKGIMILYVHKLREPMWISDQVSQVQLSPPNPAFHSPFFLHLHLLLLLPPCVSVILSCL